MRAAGRLHCRRFLHMATPSWLQRLRSAITRHRITRPHHNAPPRFRPRLLILEDRVLPSAYLVTTTGDSGAGSLRDAINQINADVNPDGSSKLSYTNSDLTRDEIDFAIPANDPNNRHFY